MGWGLHYKGYINRVTSREIDSRLADREDEIKRCRSELTAMVVMTPQAKQLEEGGWLMPHEYLPAEVEEMLEAYEEAVAERAKLLDAKDHLECGDENDKPEDDV